MAEFSLKAKKRELTTKGYLTQLREKGFIPGVFYIKNEEARPIYVSEHELRKFVFTPETHIIALSIEDGEEMHCILSDVQFDPVTDKVIHFDLHGVTYGQLLHVQVPIQIVGTAVGIKEGGILQHQLHKADIECFPRHIPKHLEVDVTNLSIGQIIRVGDLQFENIKFLNPADAAVVSVIHSRVEEAKAVTEAVPGEETTAEPEVISKGKSEDKE
ncbi:MAG: 50S ribosomal protein L25 [Ignavibacteriales bacterium]|nr:50S ribosomal protein L25 [Ignavibacteriales bacterium]